MTSGTPSRRKRVCLSQCVYCPTQCLWRICFRFLRTVYLHVCTRSYLSFSLISFPSSYHDLGGSSSNLASSVSSNSLNLSNKPVPEVSPKNTPGTCQYVAPFQFPFNLVSFLTFPPPIILLFFCWLWFHFLISLFLPPAFAYRRHNTTSSYVSWHYSTDSLSVFSVYYKQLEEEAEDSQH